MAGARPRARDELESLLGPRHVDALTTAVRALNTTITKAELARAKDAQAAAAREERQLAALEQIAKYTANLPALMDLLVTKRTNGQGHNEENADAG